MQHEKTMAKILMVDPALAYLHFSSVGIVDKKPLTLESCFIGLQCTMRLQPWLCCDWQQKTAEHASIQDLLVTCQQFQTIQSGMALAWT